MVEKIEINPLYQSPILYVSELDTEGFLCQSQPIEDWEENEDIL